MDQIAQQVKSKKRVADHGEVFTAEREVNAMLDLVKDETLRIDSRFLEPACGNGNFLAEVLRRKLDVVQSRYAKNQTDYERNAITAISSIYGIDILEDNAQECRDRLLDIFHIVYLKIFKSKCNEDCLQAVRYILLCNIIWGDALSFKNPSTGKPIIFAEWTPINGTMIKRKDFVFQFLVEKTLQLSLFDENDQPQHFDQEVKDYPPIHYLNIGKDDTDHL
jgi:hypothetical protein